MDNLEKYAWVPCGYAALRDVRRAVHEDRLVYSLVIGNIHVQHILYMYTCLELKKAC